MERSGYAEGTYRVRGLWDTPATVTHIEMLLSASGGSTSTSALLKT